MGERQSITAEAARDVAFAVMAVCLAAVVAAQLLGVTLAPGLGPLVWQVLRWIATVAAVIALVAAITTRDLPEIIITGGLVLPTAVGLIPGFPPFLGSIVSALTPLAIAVGSLVLARRERGAERWFAVVAAVFAAAWCVLVFALLVQWVVYVFLTVELVTLVALAVVALMPVVRRFGRGAKHLWDTADVR
jgi:hypothetical protein